VKEVASISMLILPNGEPGVRLSASPEFLGATAAQRATLLCAAIQLCGAAVAALYNDYPDEMDDITEVMENMAIAPSDQLVN